jgi:hypothetical protein
VRTSTPMAKCNGMFEERWKPLLHLRMMPRCGSYSRSTS